VAPWCSAHATAQGAAAAAREARCAAACAWRRRRALRRRGAERGCKRRTSARQRSAALRSRHRASGAAHRAARRCCRRTPPGGARLALAVRRYPLATPFAEGFSRRGKREPPSSLRASPRFVRRCATTPPCGAAARACCAPRCCPAWQRLRSEATTITRLESRAARTRRPSSATTTSWHCARPRGVVRGAARCVASEAARRWRCRDARSVLTRGCLAPASGA